MRELAQLESIRSHRGRHREWPAEFEEHFRKSQRWNHRGPRALLFLVHGLCIGGAPFYGIWLFQASAEVQAWLSPCLVAAGALLLTTAVLTWRNVDHSLTKVCQVGCVFTSGLGVVFLRYLALQHELNFPAHLVSVVIVSLLVFGGYAWKRMAIGAICCFSLAAFIELRFNPVDTIAAVQIYCLGLMALLTVVNVYTQEFIARTAWIDHRYADALARTDVLTGLSTRSQFNLVFESRLAQARRDGRRVAVMMLDIDHFKRVNDGYGHLFGDAVLRAVGSVILEGFARRPLDLRVRFGGEEMVILWYDIDESHLQPLAEKLLGEIRAVELIDPASLRPVSITASVGLTSVIPDETTQPLALLHKADELLYRAKTQGRDRAVIEPFATRPEQRSLETARL